MESNDVEEEEFGFSRNYFLAKELGGSGKKASRKLSEINVVDEQVLLWMRLCYYVIIDWITNREWGFTLYLQELRDAYANIEPKHEKEIRALVDSYKKSYSEWAFVLR